MICRDCKHCKRLYVPVVPSLDHARTVRDRFVCIALANEGIVQYLGDDEGKCELFSPKGEECSFCEGEAYHDENYCDIWMKKNKYCGDMELEFDTSSGEYATGRMKIQYCPVCGKRVKV